MLMRQCPITSGLPTKMAEASFRRLCATKREDERNTYCRETCRGKHLPPGLEFITLAAPQGENMGDTTTTKRSPLPAPVVALPLKQIPAERIDTLTPTDLEEFFTMPPLKKERGQCPICERVGIVGGGNGMCGRCVYHAKGKTGRELLRALQNSLNTTRGGASQRVGKTVAIGTSTKPTASTPSTPCGQCAENEAILAAANDQLGTIALLHSILRPFGNEPIHAVAERVVKRVAELDRLYTEAQEECVAVQRQLKEATGRAPRTGMAGAIEASCLGVMEFLLQKNDAYGNSAADPVRIFSHADPLEQINVRIDDKLSRLMRGGSYPGDDDELDLLGYLMLKRAVRLYHAEQKREAA